MKTSPFSNKSFIDNSNRIAKIIYRFDAYRKLFVNALINKVPVKELLITQFPFQFNDLPKPPIVSIELTNYCNLKCNYCPSPLGLRSRGYMDGTTFQNLIASLKQNNISRLRMVGNGESTLHPEFSSYAKQIAKHVKFFTIVTNAQWKNLKIADTLLMTPFQMVGISIDGSNAVEYESSRIGGSYERLLRNLTYLKKQRDLLKSKTRINIRLMLRPSQVERQDDHMKFWKGYADSVMPQYITHIKETPLADDIFTPIQRSSHQIPKCSLIFKNLEIRWTGQVLLCGSSVYQNGNGGLELGNIKDLSITDLWNGHIMKTFRKGHRFENKSEIGMCKGCQGY
ncbi:MAG: hypothetical protein K0Q95_836 [Bacteroidota bacterium]|jgi:MoaA/NifB/PqqE/SkfB family radical SAM enzyme|nr:hypothetical protein [Bacteroidota bacterium]